MCFLYIIYFLKRSFCVYVYFALGYPYTREMFLQKRFLVKIRQSNIFKSFHIHIFINLFLHFKCDGRFHSKKGLIKIGNIRSKICLWKSFAFGVIIQITDRINNIFCYNLADFLI